jgi:hypothetical protein
MLSIKHPATTRAQFLPQESHQLIKLVPLTTIKRDRSTNPAINIKALDQEFPRAELAQESTPQEQAQEFINQLLEERQEPLEILPLDQMS